MTVAYQTKNHKKESCGFYWTDTNKPYVCDY